MKTATTRYGLTMGRGVKRPSKSDGLDGNKVASPYIIRPSVGHVAQRGQNSLLSVKRLRDSDWLSSRLPTPVGARGLRDAFGRSKEEQNAIGAVVLLRAFDCLARSGWAPPGAGGNRLSLRDAVWAAHDERRNPIDTVYATRLLERFAWPLDKWETHPLRTRLDVMRLLQAAIALGGVEPPPMPARFGPKRRGGWVVSHGRAH